MTLPNHDALFRLKIDYHFDFDGGGTVTFGVDTDLSRQDPGRYAANRRSWTRLASHQCSGCPLDPDDYPDCPAALSIADVIEHFSAFVSFSRVRCRIEFPDKTVSAEKTLQDVLYSLLGLRMATSDCPFLKDFKPMARFHEPFSTPLSTAYRAVSMHLLRSYFLNRRGGRNDWSLEGLRGFYDVVNTVNGHMAARLREAAEKDAIPNSLVALDIFSTTMTFFLDDYLRVLDVLFSGSSGD